MIEGLRALVDVGVDAHKLKVGPDGFSVMHPSSYLDGEGHENQQI